MLARLADVVREQGIDLGNTGGERHERRADGTTRTDVVAVILGVFNELLRDDIQHGEAVFDDGTQFLFEAFRNVLRRIVTVDPVHTIPAQTCQFFIGAVDMRRERTLRDRLETLDKICDTVGVFHDDLIRRFITEISELRKHLLGRAEIQRRLSVGVRKAHSGHDDGAENAVVRLKEMHVARGDRHFTQFVAEADDAAVDVFKISFRADVRTFFVVNEESVVAGRLDLEIIVESCNIQQFLVRLFVEDRAEYLSRFTCRTEDQTFAVLYEPALRNAGDLGTFSDAEEFKVGHRD